MSHTYTRTDADCHPERSEESMYFDASVRGGKLHSLFAASDAAQDDKYVLPEGEL